MDPNTLHIALWNANGLCQHRQEVEVFLRTNNIDILLVSESHFTDKSYFKVSGYRQLGLLCQTGELCNIVFFYTLMNFVHIGNAAPLVSTGRTNEHTCFTPQLTAKRSGVTGVRMISS